MPLPARFSSRHECAFMRDPRLKENSKSPYATLSEKLYLWVINFTTIDMNCVDSSYVRSYAVFMKERQRHLDNPNYRFVIHPFSKFEKSKQLVMAVLWYIALILQSYLGTFSEKDLYFRRMVVIPHIVLFLNVVFLLDIAIQFRTGYKEETTKSVILNRRMVTYHYLKTFFFFDFVAAVSYLFFYFLPTVDKSIQIFLFQLHAARLPRLANFLRKVSELLQEHRVPETVGVPVMLLVTGLTMLHLLTCMCARVGVYQRLYDTSSHLSWVHQYKKIAAKQFFARNIHMKTIDIPGYRLYLLYLMVTSCHFFGAGTSIYRTRDNIERFTLSLTLMMGMSFYIYSLAKILQLFGVLNISEMKFESLRMQSESYMVQKSFPRELRKRIFKYYDYKYNNKFFSELDVLGTLSEHLKMEVLLYSCRNLIERVHAFKGLSRSDVGCILALLKQEIFVPGDTLLYSTEDTGCIYFILLGTCGIISIKGKEMAHIEDGDFFGNISPRDDDILYSILALEMVEVYKLEPKDLSYCCTTHPTINDKLLRMEKAKYRRYINLFAQDDEYITEDILRELRKKRIVEQGLQRRAFD
ncbi:hypothetical protein Zmor_016875 [Zophobas morio]|uniref:Cyclic nucleotide-binding domain-containing protein n=1 Tax=Zophobas morio TaxID=2755281 RepID=A0AA38MC18_9CUCU|nr:hypothetical protein Zmor_016875 [Zophobas morio]